jgi:hypothetical protein
MDYTLAQYKPETFEALAHEQTVRKLVEVFGYPSELYELPFDWTYMMRGLVIDKVPPQAALLLLLSTPATYTFLACLQCSHQLPGAVVVSGGRSSRLLPLLLSVSSNAGTADQGWIDAPVNGP